MRKHSIRLKPHEKLRKHVLPMNSKIRWLFRISKNYQELCIRTKQLSHRIENKYIVKKKRIKQRMEKRKKYLNRKYQRITYGRLKYAVDPITLMYFRASLQENKLF